MLKCVRNINKIVFEMCYACAIIRLHLCTTINLKVPRTPEMNLIPNLSPVRCQSSNRRCSIYRRRASAHGRFLSASASASSHRGRPSSSSVLMTQVTPPPSFSRHPLSRHHSAAVRLTHFRSLAIVIADRHARSSAGREPSTRQ